MKNRPLKEANKLIAEGNVLAAAELLANYILRSRESNDNPLLKAVRSKLDFLVLKLKKNFQNKPTSNLTVDLRTLNDSILIETFDGQIKSFDLSENIISRFLANDISVNVRKIHIHTKFRENKDLSYFLSLWGAELIVHKVSLPDEKRIEETVAESGIKQLLHGSSIDECIFFANGYLLLDGWIVLEKKALRVDVYVGDKLIGRAIYGKKREDVISAMKYDKKFLNCGLYFLARLDSDLEGSISKVVLKFIFDDGDGDSLDIGCSLKRVDSNFNADEKIEEIIKYSIDSPNINNGIPVAETKVFTIAGWVIGVNEISQISIFLNGNIIGNAYHGIKREDVSIAFPEYQNTLRSGFVFNVNIKKIEAGVHEIGVHFKDKNGIHLTKKFNVNVKKPEHTGPSIELARIYPHSNYLLDLESIERRCVKTPLLAICVLGGGSSDKIDRTIRSLWKNAYQNYLIVLDTPHVGKISAPESLRKKIVARKEGWIDSLSPEYISFVNPGDTYGADALVRIALEASLDQSDFVVFDDNRFVEEIDGFESYLKPSWSPCLLDSENYIGDAYFVKCDLVKSVFKKNVDVWTLKCHPRVLIFSHFAKSFKKINEVLFQHDKDAPLYVKDVVNFIPYIEITNRNIEIDRGYHDCGWNIKNKLSKGRLVSIIIPSIGSRGLVENCIKSIRNAKTDVDYEIIVVDNHKNGQTNNWRDWFAANADIVIEDAGKFNWSRLNNLGAKFSNGDYLLFLNDDIEILNDYWLEALVEPCEGGAWVVGCLMIYPDHKIQHSGMFLSQNANARHAFRYTEDGSLTYFNLAYLKREVSAVTGACMLISKGNFLNVGGFDENHAVINNDLDFCLKVIDRGQRVVYTPHVRMVHHEMVSREAIDDVFDSAIFDGQWKNYFMNGDPYHHPRLDKNTDDYDVAVENLRYVVPPYPIYDKDSIKRILVVKLDHIGDAVTSINAIKRLNEHFPHAKLTVLCGKWARPIFESLDEVDEVAVFNFFQAQSGLGRISLTADDFVSLSKNLQGEFYDLAVDLRKVHDTRHFLNLADPRVSSGFNHDNHNCWLDISLEWEKDTVNYDKKTHVSCDLVNLVDVINNASKDYRIVSRDLKKNLIALECEPKEKYVCIHPWSGNSLRQWPVEYFAELANLLAFEGYLVYLIGSESEKPVGESIVKLCSNQSLVFSKMGEVTLEKLPDLISGAAFFVGNNSGPAHMAAFYGVPSISIHSGVISSEEWAPYGGNSFAIRLDTECSPCYRESPGDCHRDIYCLRRIYPTTVMGFIKRLVI